MRAFARITALGLPVMSAVSRKDFVGALTGRRPSERLAGTLAAVGWAVLAGARLIRAHDVAETRDFLAVLGALSGESVVPAELRIDEAIRREPQPATLRRLRRLTSGTCGAWSPRAGAGAAAGTVGRMANFSHSFLRPALGIGHRRGLARGDRSRPRRRPARRRERRARAGAVCVPLPRASKPA